MSVYNKVFLLLIQNTLKILCTLWIFRFVSVTTVVEIIAYSSKFINNFLIYEN